MKPCIVVLQKRWSENFILGKLVFRVCPHAGLIFNNNTWTGSSTVSNYAFQAYTDVQKKKKLYKRKREKKIKCPWSHPESNPQPLDPKAGAILTEPRCLSYIHYAILVTYNQHIGLPPHFHPNQIKNAEILLHILPLLSVFPFSIPFSIPAARAHIFHRTIQRGKSGVVRNEEADEHQDNLEHFEKRSVRPHDRGVHGDGHSDSHSDFNFPDFRSRMS